MLFGFGAFTYAKHPEGIIEAQTTASIAKTVAIFERFRSKPTTPDPDDSPVRCRGRGHGGAGQRIGDIA